MSGTERYINFVNSESFERIMKYNEEQLEKDHAFIQWIFPTVRASAFNNNAPLLNLNDFLTRREFQDCKSKMLNRSLPLMLNHFGISKDMTSVENERKFRYLDGHNGLRFSRILQSLQYHDLGETASKLYLFVISNVTERGVSVAIDKISREPIWLIRLKEAEDEMENLYN